jgi:hypothetical protein
MPKTATPYFALTGLAFCFIATALLGHILYPDGQFTIQLHDTYFIFSVWFGIGISFIVLSNLYLLVYQLFNRWNNRLINIIQLILLIIFNMGVALNTLRINNWIKMVNPSQEGWTIYPPLDALPKAMEAANSSAFSNLSLALAFLVSLSFIYLVLVSYRTLQRAGNQ